MEDTIDVNYAIAIVSAMELFFTENPKSKITKKDFFNTKEEILKYSAVEDKTPVKLNYIG